MAAFSFSDFPVLLSAVLSSKGSKVTNRYSVTQGKGYDSTLPLSFSGLLCPIPFLCYRKGPAPDSTGAGAKHSLH